MGREGYCPICGAQYADKNRPQEHECSPRSLAAINGADTRASKEDTDITLSKKEFPPKSLWAQLQEGFDILNCDDPEDYFPRVKERLELERLLAS
jgi:hypothetical protein